MSSSESTPLLDDPKKKGPWRQYFARNEGLLLVAASQLFFAAMNVAVKKMSTIEPIVPTMQLVFVRMGLTYVCGLAYMFIAKIPYPVLGPPGVRLLLIMRGVFGFVGLSAMYSSLRYLSLSDSTVVTFLAPITTGIAGKLFLHEPFTLKQVLAGFCSLIGVVMIARPTFIFDGKASPSSGDVTPEERIMAVGMCLITVVGMTGAYTTIRGIGSRAHAIHAMSAFCLVSVLATGPAMLITRTPFVIPTRPMWIVMFLQIGVFGFIGQILLTLGLQRENVGRGSMAIYTEIVFAMIMDLIFFAVIPSRLSAIGTVVIISSATYVSLMKEKTKQPVDKLSDAGSAEREALQHHEVERGARETEN